MNRDVIRPKKSGIIHLVGAGPGDPMLLTRRAEALLARADVVAYDDLVHPSLLALAKPEAILLPVGYRGLRDAAMTQAVLAPEVIAYAQDGYEVVRLKTGDPLVLGRGGEEALALKKLGIAFTIVPGITAALGAAAAAGIPLTHRSLAGGFRLMTGHRLSDMGRWPSDLGPSDETLVVYMVRKHLQQLVDDLLERGWRSDTPAAFVINATTPGQKTLTATLESLPSLVAALDDAGPGLAVIGPTVRLHQELFPSRSGAEHDDARVLAGSRILVARARPGVSQVASALRDLGGDVIELPLVVAKQLKDYSDADAELRRLAAYDHWVFGCEQSVRMFFRRLGKSCLDVRDLPRRKVWGVGAAAVRALARFGWQADVALAGACDAALEHSASQLEGTSLLLFTHSGGRPQLTRSFAARGAQVRALALYELKKTVTRVVAPHPQVIVVPSSSAARDLFGGDLGFDPRLVPVVAIGPESASTARSLGACEVLTATHDDLGDLVRLTVEVVRRLHREKEELHRRVQGAGGGFVPGRLTEAIQEG